MKEFNLEEAKAGKPVYTREGKPARIICWDKKGESFPIVALIEDDGRELIGIYTQEGLSQIGIKDEIDLVMESEKHEGYINLYRLESGEIQSGSVVFESESNAKDYENNDGYVATIKINWEE